MRAIISDIHSNIEALGAVLDDIGEQGVDEILCLGDIVGYGPDPEKAIDVCEAKCRFCLSGNHDYAVLTRAEGFNALAEEAVDFTRNALKPGTMAGSRKRARWRFLQECPTRVLDDDVLYVHGSPRDDRTEYILESDVLFGNAEKIEDIFMMTPHLLFVGHTHMPGIIGMGSGFWHPEDNGAQHEIRPEAKLIVNVGSVGQPRDGDNRACYVLADKERVIYRRVPYDFRKTIAKMDRVGPVSVQAGERIAYGR